MGAPTSTRLTAIGLHNLDWIWNGRNRNYAILPQQGLNVARDTEYNRHKWTITTEILPNISNKNVKMPTELRD